MKQVHGDKVLGHSAMFKWDQHFVLGKESLENDAHTDQSQTVLTQANIEEVATFVHASHSQSIDATTIDISHSSCHKILSDDLNMSYVSQHIIPCILTQN